MSLQETADLAKTIRSHEGQLNPAQNRIAAFILENPDAVAGMAIGTLAKNCNVSEASVSRFVKFLGCANYRGFQAALMRSNLLRQDRARGYPQVEHKDDDWELCRKVFGANIQCLTDSLEGLDPQAIAKTADLIAARKKLCIIAQGRSMVTATSIRQRLCRLGIACTSCSDPHEQAITVSLLEPGDVLMGISTFGRSKNVLKNLRFAAAHGVHVVGVSSYRDTPLSRIAEIMLYTTSNEDGSFGFEPACSAVSQMVMLDCLYIMVTNRMREDARRCFDISCRAIESERE